MEVDKVANEVTDMEIDKQTDDMVVNITNEDFFGVTLAKIITNTNGATWWPNFQLIQVAPPDGQISN